MFEVMDVRHLMRLPISVAELQCAKGEDRIINCYWSSKHIY